MIKNKINYLLLIAILILFYSCKMGVISSNSSYEEKELNSLKKSTKIGYNLYNYADSIGRCCNYFNAIDSVLKHKDE